MFVSVRFAALLTVAALALAACARSGPPAPVEIRGSEAQARPSAPAILPAPTAISQPEPGPTGDDVIVQPGDTLFGLARRTKAPIRALIEVNRLQPPYVLQPGQRLALPQGRTYTVQGGDTVYGISRRYGVDMSTLVRANGIPSPYHIQVGQALLLPDSVAAPAETVRPVAPPARGGDRVETATLPPPAPATSPIPAAPPTLPPPQTGSAPPVARIDPPPVERPPSAPPESKPPPSLADAGIDVPARTGRTFLWPVRGSIVSDFGPKGGGLHNDGLNIAAARGAAIRAAENGVVVYAGNELRGFGNLLLLRHADGWTTAYAHADEISVRRGDTVRRGQVIGRVGMTG
ncbi:MAG: LysM peptidoglycan-binding domain-containing protein, partial [Rhodospirillales bacterium]|nr:LysM peptidoglycan-binding domain-containing protein [Rhodospirillales bacterium]